MRSVRARLVWGVKVASLFVVLGGLLVGGPLASIRRQVEASGYASDLQLRPAAMSKLDFGRPSWLVFPGRSIALPISYDGSGVVDVASLESGADERIRLNISPSLLHVLTPSDTVLLLTDTGRQRAYAMRPDDLTPDLTLSSSHDEPVVSFKFTEAE